MRNSSEGLWLALVDAPREARRFGLVQSNRSDSEGRRSFYQERHPSQERVWRDFYYRATYGILSLIDEHWGADEILLSHPTGHGWAQDLMPTVLDALGHFADREPPVSLQRVCFSRCCLDGPEEILRAMATLNAEQSGPRPPRHEQFTPREEPLDQLGLIPENGVRLFRVDIPSPRGRHP